MSQEPALPIVELLNWYEDTAQRWSDYFAQNPQSLSLPCDIYGCSSVAELNRHIFLIALRHSQRLAGKEVIPYDDAPNGDWATVLKLHEEGVANLRALLSTPQEDGFWPGEIEFMTVSSGMLRCSRRKLAVHLLLHGIRHWAQIATLVRQAGYPLKGMHDFLGADWN